MEQKSLTTIKYPIYDTNEEDSKTLKKLFVQDNWFRILYSDEKFVAPPSFKIWHPKYQTFVSEPTDVWVVSYPKAGTTWTQEMAWCILNDLDFNKAKETNLLSRFPFFEWDGLFPEDTSSLKFDDPNDPCAPGNTWKIVNNLKKPRTYKSHMIKNLLPKDIWNKKSKIIYVSRDPKDICTSYYYHSIKLDGFLGDFNQFFDLYIKDLHYFCPLWSHMVDFWKSRNEDNILFIRYEELKEDLPKMCRKVATFLGKTLSDSEVKKLCEHLSFSSMSKNPSTNNEALMSFSDNKGIKFMRKGKVGDWRSHFSEEQIKTFKKWTEEKLKGTDFPFYREF